MLRLLRRGWIVSVCAGLILGASVGIAAAAVPAWTTYRHDSARSGSDPDSASPVTPAQAWQTPGLDGAIYAQPLVYGSRVYVATENDTVYALDAGTGSVVWQKHLATPVDASALNCGNINPTVGITSTPVIDPATGRIYVVGDTWDGSNKPSIAHEMWALNLADGSVAVGPRPVDPAGSSPIDQLQRASLSLAAGKVLIGYGANAGDCGTYNGWLVAEGEDGSSMQSFEVDAQKPGSGGAIWASGNAPPVDGSGNIWLSTGNGDSASFGYQESVIKLDANLTMVDHWTPADWASLDASDTDIGSSMPVLLPGGFVFQIGKSGTGYLLNGSNLGAGVYSRSVCDGSWGGGIYVNGVIYVACANGMHAEGLDTATGTFAPLAGWTTNGSAIDAPTFAGGLLWSTDYNSGTLYGLDPRTGATRFSTNLSGFEHFTAPSAGGGKLFVANNDPVSGSDQITAFTIAATYSGDAYYAGSGAEFTQYVSSSAPPPAGSPPALSKLHVAVVRRRLHLSLLLSEPATVKVAVSKLVPGRKVRGRCRVGAHRGRRCRKPVLKATLRFAGRLGHDVFKPRLLLAPARYAITVTAIDASGRRSAPRTVIVIVSAPHRR